MARRPAQRVIPARNNSQMSFPANPEDLAALARATAAAEAAEANPREPLLKGPKRQHYLPRFYLDGFATDGLVSVYDREKDEVRRQQPKDTAVIGRFYTMEDAQGRRRYEIEALLSEYEGKASPVIKKNLPPRKPSRRTSAPIWPSSWRLPRCERQTSLSRCSG